MHQDKAVVCSSQSTAQAATPTMALVEVTLKRTGTQAALLSVVGIG